MVTRNTASITRVRSRPLAPKPQQAADRSRSPVRTVTLGQMRYRGVRSIEARCEARGHEARILVDALPDGLPVSDVARTLKSAASR